MLHVNSLSDAVARASLNRSRLLVLPNERVGNTVYPCLNVNRELSELLVSISRQERVKSSKQLLDQLIIASPGDVVLLIGLEILFDRSLAVEPLRLLKSCAINKTLLVCWPGDITNSGLSYASPSHPEHRTYKASDLSDVIFLTADAQLH